MSVPEPFSADDVKINDCGGAAGMRPDSEIVVLEKTHPSATIHKNVT
jgi:hypothetical protein